MSKIHKSGPHVLQTIASPPQGVVRVGIIGVGYVGESLLLEFRKKYDCVGFDICIEGIQALRPLFESFQNV